MLSAENLREHRVGMVLGAPRADGKFVAADLQIDDAAAVARVDSKELKELSCGYTCKYDPTPGTFEGQHYDGVQREIRYNHVGMGGDGWGRAGSECSIRMDGQDDIAITVVAGERVHMALKIKGREIRVDQADLQLATELSAELDKESGEKDAKLAALEAENKALSEKVAAFELAALAAKAEPIVGKQDGKSAAEIRTAVIAKVLPNARLDGKSEAYVSAMFDAACEVFKPETSEGEKPEVLSGLVERKDGGERKLSPREEMIERRKNAAKGTK